MNNAITVNITELRDNLAPGLKVKSIKDDLLSIGAVVKGCQDDDGNDIMFISGDYDLG
jgi:hypothetical protein